MEANEKKNPAEATEKAPENLTMDEMEEVSGGYDIDEVVRKGVARALCQMGSHPYSLREEKKMGPDGSLYTRKVWTCKHCGHREFSGWVPFGKGG